LCCDGMADSRLLAPVMDKAAPFLTYEQHHY
jgi:hypothetical protein